MRSILAFAVLLASMLVLPGCISVRVDKEVIRPITVTHNQRVGVERAVKALIKADNRGDVDGAIDCYHPEAIWYPPGEDPITSMEYMREHYEMLFDTFDFDLKIRVRDVSIVGDIAYARGKLWGDLESRVDDVDDLESEDWYEAVLKRHDGRWKVWRLSWGPIGRELHASSHDEWLR